MSGGIEGILRAVQFSALDEEKLIFNPQSYCFQMEYGNLWELYGGVYAQGAMGHGMLKFRKAMVATTSEDERVWEINTGVPIRDFSMDVFQDLVVLVDYRNTGSERQVRFHSMSTGTPHPLAKRPVVTINATEPRFESCNIAINNDLVGILFQDQILYANQRLESNVLGVWAWKTGDMLLRLPSTLDHVVETMCFLSSSHILVGWRTLFYREGINRQVMPSLDVYEFSKGVDAQPSKRFLLPKMKETATVLEFSICCDSTPTPSQYCPRPFYTSPDHRICKVQISLGDELDGMLTRESPMTLLLFTHTFLRDYKPMGAILGEGTSTTIVPWELWGESTRLTLWNSPASVYSICVNGLRVIRKISTGVQQHFKIQLCDFNPYAVSSIESLPGKPTSTYRYVNSAMESTFNMHIFTQQVYTPLPYLEVTTKRSFEARDVMLDHDNVYLVRVSVTFSRSRDLVV
ncbi:hypothetical protein FRB91_011063 [Serendipita sp. 411]|nr:hypothetical protein FRB91_011063 [Serendipita sp. 411]